MKRWMTGLAAGLLMAFQAGAASAQDIEPYTGGGLGAYTLGNGLGNDTVFGGYGLVGLQINDMIGLEVRLGGASNGQNLNSTFGIDWYAAYLLRGTLHLNERISIYALLGGASLATFQQLRGWFKEKQTNTVFSGGAGLAYDYSDTLHLSVEGLFLGNNAAPQMPSFQGLDARAVTFNVLLTN